MRIKNIAPNKDFVGEVGNPNRNKKQNWSKARDDCERPSSNQLKHYILYCCAN